MNIFVKALVASMLLSLAMCYYFIARTPKYADDNLRELIVSAGISLALFLVTGPLVAWKFRANLWLVGTLAMWVAGAIGLLALSY